MRTSLISNFSINNIQTTQSNRYTNLAPLKADTISFGSKKSIEKKELIKEVKAEIKKRGFSGKTCPTSTLFDILGMKYSISQNGLLILEEYHQPEGFRFKDIGINENRLFKDIEGIEGDALFNRSGLKSLGNLQYIGGHAIFGYRLRNLGSLKTIGGTASFYSTKIKNVDGLQSVGKKVALEKSKLKYKDFKSLDCPSKRAEAKLKEQGVDFKTCSTRQLFDAFNMPHKIDPDDGLLILEEYIQPDDFTFKDLGIDENKLFKDIKEIKRDYNPHNEVTDFGSLERIGGNLALDLKLESLGNLKSIGGNAEFGPKLKSLGNLEDIKGNANFFFSKTTDLGNLKHVGRNVYINTDKGYPQEKDFDNIKVDGTIVCVSSF